MDELLSIVLSAKDGDEHAFEQLLQKYDALLLSMSKKYSDMCPESLRDKEDFLQEAKIAFYNSVKTYDDEKKITFGAYAKVCIRNKLVSCIRTLTSKKRLKNTQLQTEEQYFDVTQDFAISNERKTELYSIAQSNLSRYEQRVFKLYISGQRAKEISAGINKSEKSVNNAIYRIKQKLSGLIGDGI